MSNIAKLADFWTFDSHKPSKALPPEVNWIAEKFNVNHDEVKNLGKGGFGTVYGIQQKGIAVKVICEISSHNRDQIIEREACTFDHPHLLKIQYWELVDGRLYIMSDLMQGNIGSLVLNEYECWRVLYQMSQALLYLHESSFIHRDVKPTNILYAKKGDCFRYVLADFGLTRSEETMGERTRFAENGTSGFIDDETRAHGVAKESDIYALGVTMVLLLAKKCKPEGNPLEMLQRCHKCSSSMREVVRRMLLKRADRISLSDIKKHCETALNKEVQMGIELRNSENQRRSIDATDDSENGNTEPENREHSILSRLFSSPKVTPARDAKRSSGIQKQHKTKNESRNRTMTSWSEIISDVAYLFYDFVKSAKNK